jgi:predicted ATP-dependent endonuclease of OLD family
VKLSAFRIKNFRSIVDTRWISLASDNITSLIGQNESGKTSILEGLNSFSNGRITDDILRSDLSLPIVSCEFILGKDELHNFSSLVNMPSDISAHIRKSGKITINRKWNNKNESQIFYGDDEILEEYEQREKRIKEITEELVVKASKILEETSKLVEESGKEEEERTKLQKELTLTGAKIDKLERLFQRTRNERKKQSASEELTVLKKEETRIRMLFEKTDINYQKSTSSLNHLIQRSEYAQKFLSSKEINEDHIAKIKKIRKEIASLEEKQLFTVEEKTTQQVRSSMNESQSSLALLKKEKEKIESSYLFARETFMLALNSNEQVSNIEAKAWEKVENAGKELSLQQIANEVFPYLPDVTLFEDFSSLLPNRIDLEDILNLNTEVEGFNAARNFLIVSGLDASFFKESNNRILKQKIENLNGEITLHFQGYWRQRLGRNNKIRLNFELEHYDFSHPDKKGKPYLEFWIKDEHERLYPKQRSRGVRWFLSFFLELKATALENNDRGKILLIDEPGLSLHARAQEDVLKVFEDLKENIQIVYSTHSPHLVNTEKIYRVLAVQRADEYDDRSETKVFDAQSLNDVSGDTLSPIYTLLGSQISESNFIQERNNIIVEDTTSFYYLKTLFDIFSPSEKVYFLPSTDISSVPMLVNLMTGWKLKFGVLLTDRPEAKKVRAIIKDSLFHSGEEQLDKQLCIFKNFEGFENLFSTIDFKKFILKKRIGITEENLEFLRNQDMNRNELATSFALHCQNNPVKPQDFDEESRENINLLIREVLKIIK